MQFSIQKKLANGRGRVGVIHTPHGDIETPAFIVVGTKATVKALTTEQVGQDVGAQAVLANTYHLYLEPGDELVRDAGGLHSFMNWKKPTFTDSGGFQVFSLGVAYSVDGVSGRKGVSKVRRPHDEVEADTEKTDEPTSQHASLAQIDEEGVTFKSVIDGSTHRFTPERSIEIQHNIGADIMFAFDECTSPTAPYAYQREAMDRTHRWAERCVQYHRAHVKKDARGEPLQALFGIVQGGRHEDLRKESARTIAQMGFDGFGIGGSFDKGDMYTSVGWVVDEFNRAGREDAPRHLLGIGEIEDLFGGIENGADTFDCVAPTRMARNGTVYTHAGKIHLTNAVFGKDFGPIDSDCGCSTCKTYTRAYLAHLFRAHEMLAATLTSIHNLYFVVELVKKIRQAMLDDRFDEFKKQFLEKMSNKK